MAKLIRHSIPKGAIDEFIKPPPPPSHTSPDFFPFLLAFNSNSDSLTTFKPFFFLVSPSRAPVLSFARYFQAPATQATWQWIFPRGGRDSAYEKGGDAGWKF